MNQPRIMPWIIVTAGIGGWAGAAPHDSQVGDQADSVAVDRAVHALHRLTFGPTRAEVDAVAAIGVEAWLDRQLDPETIDDRDLDRWLEQFEVLRVTAADLRALRTAAQRERRQRQRTMTPPDSAASRSRPAMPIPDTSGASPQRQFARLRAQYQQLTVARFAMSNRQLQEVMVDFWTNHFNVFYNKGAVRELVPEYIETTIRPHALGRFEDLLIATATSSAMLAYLDNTQSIAPGAVPPRLEALEARLERLRNARRRRDDRIQTIEQQLATARERLPNGLNENYARELLELHTLGVDGGYDQKDVEQTARVFTGWGIGPPNRATFAFNEWAHDRGPKTILGHSFSAGGGMEEGLTLLRLLARHPATRVHVSRKLCARLVSDTPPDGCVEAGVRAWSQTDGDIPAVIRAIVQSPDFWDPTHRRAKFKSPLEFIVSALRVAGAKPDTLPGLVEVLSRLGHAPFQRESPDGYPEVQDSWVNAGAILNRLSLALGMGAGRLRGVAAFDVDNVVPLTSDVDSLVASVNRAVLLGQAGPNTLRVLREQAATAGNPTQQRALVVGYAIGSPEFQRQ